MDSKLFSTLLGDYLLPSGAGTTLRALLEAHADENIRAFQLAPLLGSNPAYARLLLTQPMLARKVADWTEEDPRRADKDAVFLQRSLGLLGKTAARNFVASLRLIRSGASGTPRKKTDRLNVQPGRKVPWAMACEALCADRNWVHPETAFWGGLHYDWITSLAAARKAPKEVATVCFEAFREGARTAQLAYEIASKLPAVEHGRYVFAAACVLPLGKPLLAALFPGTGTVGTWAGHLQSCELLGPQRAYAEEFLEMRHFRVRQVELSALHVSSMGLLTAVEPAIRFAREPWMLEAQPGLAQLATILGIASALAVDIRIKPDQELPLAFWQRKWLEQNGIKEEALRKSLTQVTEVRVS